MIAHLTLPVSSYEKARDFYKKVAGAVGYELTMDTPDWRAAGFKEGGHTSFWVRETKELVPFHVAFEAKNKEQVDEFHKAALELGAKDNGGPGYRKEYWPGYYAAFIYDLDGHNIEAVWYDYDAK